MWPLKKRQPQHVDDPRPQRDETKPNVEAPRASRDSELDRMLKEIALVSQEAARRRKMDAPASHPPKPVD